MSETPKSNSPDGQMPLSPESALSNSNGTEFSNSKPTPISHLKPGDEQIQGSDALGFAQSESGAPWAPSALEPFDWDAFTAQYEVAIAGATDGEKAIMKEVESLSRYFGAWASAASVHDDERAAKRLQTRQRFVNLSEETMVQKQKHCHLATMPLQAAMSSSADAAEIPQVTAENFASFHEAHFAVDAVAQFTVDFVTPSDAQAGAEVDYTEYEEDDGLGYYEDGVKRTLTDEQIEIFRHSELREFERAREKAAEAKAKRQYSSDETAAVVTEEAVYSDQTPRNKKNGKRKAKQQLKREPKPRSAQTNLDVVEAGLDSLDYD